MSSICCLTVWRCWLVAISSMTCRSTGAAKLTGLGSPADSSPWVRSPHTENSRRLTDSTPARSSSMSCVRVGSEVLVIGLDDAGHKRVPHHVAFAEFHEGDAFDAAQYAFRHVLLRCDGTCHALYAAVASSSV